MVHQSWQVFSFPAKKFSIKNNIFRFAEAKKNERVVLEKEKGEKLTRAHDSQKSFVISWKVTGFWKELFIGWVPLLSQIELSLRLIE